MSLFDFLKPKPKPQQKTKQIDNICLPQPIHNKPHFDLPLETRDWLLTLEFAEVKSSSFSQILKQAQRFSSFKEREEQGKILYSINFLPNQILEFDELYMSMPV